MSLFVGILNSTELYLRIQDNLEIELTTSKAYYALSIDLHKTLNLNQINRQGEPRLVLEEYYKRYEDLIQQGNLLSASYPDKLATLPKIKGIFKKLKSSSSSSSSSSNNSLGSNNPINIDEEGKHEAEL
jgi:hypothetical protein